MTKEPSANILGLFHKKSILRNTIISNVLLIICVSFTLIRFWFAVQTPLVPHMNSLFDDQVFVAYAKSILEKTGWAHILILRCANILDILYSCVCALFWALHIKC